METSGKPKNTNGIPIIEGVPNRTFTKGQKVKVLVGCVWQNVEVEDYHSDPKYYLCGTNSWSTHFHESSIKSV